MSPGTGNSLIFPMKYLPPVLRDGRKRLVKFLFDQEPTLE
jgi:hypothetical protein